MELYRAAAKGGYVPAMCDLGLCYENGDGVEEDLRHAVLWYRKSAEEGYAPGQCNLAVCYLNGNGVERDAVRWLEKAAAQGNARAQSILGDLCRDGEGTEMDAARAFQLYTQAAEQGYPPAQCALGYCYEGGAARRRTRPRPWSGMPGPPSRSTPGHVQPGPVL